MKDFMKKTALLLLLVLAITSIPVSAKAATTPAFRTTRTAVYENGDASGVYTYTVSGVQKGYKVKWGITGSGKPYVTFKDKITVAAKTTVSNKITINTAGNLAASNKKFNVIAKVYDKSGKLIVTLKDKPTIKISAESMTMDTGKIATLDSIPVGNSYDFDVNVIPANTTSKVYWSVKSLDGSDYSSEIDDNGVWVPKKAGQYTITATAKNSQNGKVLATSQVNATVGVYLKAVTQTGVNEIKAVFSADVKDKLNINNISIKTKTGASGIIPKSFTYDAVGKTVTITTYQNLKDNVEYEVTYGTSSKSFTASVGEPVAAKIITDAVPVNTLTPIEYALYDENGIDVKNVCEGEVVMEATVVDGYFISDDKELFMHKLGNTTTVTLTYKSSHMSVPLTTSKIITCVEPEVEEAATTNFTITSSAAAPDYTDSSYKDNMQVTLGEKGYAHFRALDANGNEISYDSITYTSSDNNMLIVSSNGEITPIKAGTVNVIIGVKRENAELPYVFTVTIKEAKKLSDVSLSKDYVTMSNVSQVGYQQEVGVTIYDQYGNEMDLSKASVEIKELNNKTVYAYYDVASQKIIVKNTYITGNYNYKVTVTMGGQSVYTILGVEVKTVPSNGVISYAIEMNSENVIDVAIDKYTISNKTATIRLAKYRGGVFESYVMFNSATIMKDNKYFTIDLTADGSENVVTLGGSSALTITAMQLMESSGVGICKKAETGNYTITMNYYNSGSNAYTTIGTTIKVVDSQEQPVVIIEDTVSDNVTTNALDLVKECISVSSGEIYDCKAVGEKETGSKISISSGKQLHIETISVKETITTGNAAIPVVYIYHTIKVGQTLTNR